MEENKRSIVKQKATQFALKIIEFSEELEVARKYVIAKQILRSGTSIGANIREAQHAESRMDFIHKMKIAAKEAAETYYWLELCAEAKNYPTKPQLKENCLEIQKILSKIIATSRGNISKQ